MNWIKILTACATLYCTGSFAQDNLVTNGTFDIEVPTNGSGGGWSSANLDGGWAAWHLSGDNYYFILNARGEPQIDPMIEQTLAGLVVGGSYLVKGEYRNHYGVSWCNISAYSFGVEVDDQVILELKYLSDIFSPFEATFTATAEEQIIRFSAERNGSDCDYAIDNIRVYYLYMIFKDSFE
jgi:hypothetical protein